MAATMMPQQYCLRWKHHHSNVQSMFAQLLEKERFCDVTLYCSPSFVSQVDKGDVVDPETIKGVSLRAHRVVLAACSELLGSLLAVHEPLGEPVLVIDGAAPAHVRALLAYMYTGEMSVHHSQLPSLLKTAEDLKIKGLTDIRWNNKDEPPDSHTGDITTTTAGKQDLAAGKPDLLPGKPDVAAGKSDLTGGNSDLTAGKSELTGGKPELAGGKPDLTGGKPDLTAGKADLTPGKVDLKTYARREPPEQETVKEENRGERSDTEKCSVNGGPPPLIKLPSKDKPPISPSTIKREFTSDNESPSPVQKRQRMTSGMEPDDDDREHEWRHGNLDISAERVAPWGGEEASGGSWDRDDTIKCEPGGEEDEEWGDAPADIGSFLHTRLRVDGDNSCEDSNEGASPSTSSSLGAPSGAEMRILNKVGIPRLQGQQGLTAGPKSGPTDPRFTDVIKLNDYLRHGRRPQFWEEDYVKRVMEAIRLKELEMKQAAEILGVSYGTLYGRYRDAYGCINRPFRTTRELWGGKTSSEVLERLKRGDIPMDVAAQALGVSARDLYVHFTDLNPPEEKFEPIPIEIDPSLRLKTPPAFAAANINMHKIRKNAAAVERAVKRVLIGSLHDEEIPATVISAQDCKRPQSQGRWRMPQDGPSSPADPLSTPSTPSAGPASPTLLMKSRPDLTIVAAKKPDIKREHPNGT